MTNTATLNTSNKNSLKYVREKNDLKTKQTNFCLKHRERERERERETERERERERETETENSNSKTFTSIVV